VFLNYMKKLIADSVQTSAKKRISRNRGRRRRNEEMNIPLGVRHMHGKQHVDPSVHCNSGSSSKKSIDGEICGVYNYVEYDI
jgi:hypothetical protein